MRRTRKNGNSVTVRVAAAAALCLCAVSCTQDAPRRALRKAFFDPRYAVIEPAWQRQLVDLPGLSYRPQMFGRAAVSPDGRYVYIGTGLDNHGRAFLYCLRRHDGEQVWRKPFPAAINSEPLYVTSGDTEGMSRDDMLYFGGDNGKLYAVTAASGEIAWEYQSNGVTRAQPAFQAGRVFFATDHNMVYALDAYSGEWIWHFQRDLPTGFSIDGTAGPVVAGQRVLVAMAEGTVGALQLEDGAAVWTKVLGSAGKPFRNVNRRTVPWRDGWLVPVYSDGLVNLDPATGDEKWSIAVDGPSAPAIAAGKVFVGDADGRFLAYDIATRKRLWSFRYNRGFTYDPVFLTGGFVGFATSEKRYFILRSEDGKIADIFDSGYGIETTPWVGKSDMFLLSNAGHFYRLRLLP